MPIDLMKEIESSTFISVHLIAGESSIKKGKVLLNSESPLMGDKISFVETEN